QVLVRLDDRIYVQRLEQAKAGLLAQEANLANVVQAKAVREANIASTEAAIATAQAQRANADAQFERAQIDHHRSEMLVSKGFVSARERDRTGNALDQAVAAQKVARAGILQANAARAAAQE